MTGAAAAAGSGGSYDKQFWNEYADTNHSRYDAEFAGRILYTATELGCASVLEVGCGTGIDLRLLAGSGIRAYGLDPNLRAVTIARSGAPFADFARGMITCMPFGDSSIDLVFTHRLLNYLDDDTVSRGMREMYRVAKKHVVNCEWSVRGWEEAEDAMDKRRSLRNMPRRWAGMGVQVMADAPIHAAAGDGAVHDDSSSNGDGGLPAETRITLVQVV